MRKLMVTLLIAVFLISSAGFVSANFDDVAGTEFENAVITLTALGLFQGYPDGTFQPDGSITRAEYATVVVRALGLDNVADYSKGETMFSDVPATHWASGYINIAVDQGIINGYPDGTFKPSNPVSGAEALAMLVRVLGYDPVVTGSWPTGYLVKAFELGVSTGVQFTASAPTNRGTVALFLNNALYIPLMEPVWVGAIQTYEVTAKNLLEDKLGFAVTVGRITETGAVLDTALGANQVMIGATAYNVVSGLDLTGLLGRTVRAWQKGGTIYVVAPVAENVVTGTIVAIGGGSVTVGTKAYDFDADDVVAYRNFFREGAPAGAAGNDVWLVLDGDGDVAFIGVMDLGVGVINKIEPQFGRITVYEPDNTLHLWRTVDEEFIVVKNGVAGDFDDLVVGDIVYFFNENDYLYLWTIDDQIEGEIEAVHITPANAIVLVVDGESYACAGNAQVSAQLSGFADLDEASIVDYIGEEVTVYFDRTGKALLVISELEVTPAVPAMWAVVHTARWDWEGPDGWQSFLRLRMADGSLVRYNLVVDGYDSFAEETILDVDLDLLDGANTGLASTDIVDLNPGDVITFKLNNDGEIAEIEEPEFDPVGEDIKNDWTFNKANDLFINGDTYKLLPTTLIFDVVGVKIVSYDAFKAAAFADPTTIVDFLVNGSFLTAIRLDGSDLTTPTPGVVDKAGIVMARWVTSDGTMISILVEDVEYAFLVDCTPDSYDKSNWDTATNTVYDLKPGDYVDFYAAAGKYTTLTEELADELDGEYEYFVKSYNADTGVLTIITSMTDPGAAEETYFVTTDTVIYDCTGTPVMVDVDDLLVGRTIQVFSAAGIAEVIKVIK